MFLPMMLVAGCNLTLGGPEAAAVNYVRTLVEQPMETAEHEKVYSHLPNRVIIEYARALHMQGIDQKYRSQKLTPGNEPAARVSVAIIPNNSDVYEERDHTLLIDLRKDGKQGWIVIGVRAQP